MDLYLMQHGEALTAAQDESRPLSEQGRRSVRLTASRAAASGVRIGRIVHSGKLRAEQTATILAEALGSPVPQSHPGLSPNDPVKAARQWIVPMAAEGPVAVVGHLPFMDRLAGLLVADDEQVQVVAFRNGGLVRLVADEPASAGGPGAWRVAWVVTPEVA